MTRAEFFAVLRQHSPALLVERFLSAKEISLFASATDYIHFQSRVAAQFSEAEMVCVVGSGNWGYSLNPDKGLFREFSPNSDVDVAVISQSHYQQTWDQIRDYHRRSWYKLGYDQQQYLRRRGENIYSGFVCPKWIPDTRSVVRFEFERALNRLSDGSVGFRKVNALFFRNLTETADYYLRGFTKAKANLPS